MSKLVLPKPAPANDRPVGGPWPLPEAARFLSVSARHLVRLADAGKLNSIRIGARRFIPDAEVQRLAREGA